MRRRAMKCWSMISPGARARPGVVGVLPVRSPGFSGMAGIITADITAAPALVPPKSNPRALAEKIVSHLERDPDVVSLDIAGPGFINLRIEPEAWRREIAAIAEMGDAYGRSAMGGGKRVNVEYVSANPTGPMHMGHCRGAVVGDALCGLLEFAGHTVTREY